jgi:hypothetical protein
MAVTIANKILNDGVVHEIKDVVSLTISLRYHFCLKQKAEKNVTARLKRNQKTVANQHLAENH